MSNATQEAPAQAAPAPTTEAKPETNGQTPNYGGTLIAVDSIKVGKRYRYDLGDLTELADSLKADGMAQPVVVDGEWNLIAGERRIEAAKLAGMTSIPVRVVHGLDEHGKLRLELAENLGRKNFTVTERAAIAKDIEAKEKAKAEARRKSGAKAEGERGRAADVAAAAVGMDRKTVEAIAKVKEKGARELVAALDKGEIKPHTAAQLADLPKAEQKKAVAGGKPSIKEAVELAKAKEDKAKAEAELPVKDEEGNTLTAEQAANLIGADDKEKGFEAIRVLLRDSANCAREAQELLHTNAKSPWGAWLAEMLPREGKEAKGDYHSPELKKAIRGINAAMAILKAAWFAAQCKLCEGTGVKDKGVCTRCKGNGYLSRGRLDAIKANGGRVPKEDKEEAAK